MAIRPQGIKTNCGGSAQVSAGNSVLVYQLPSPKDENNLAKVSLTLYSLVSAPELKRYLTFVGAGVKNDLTLIRNRLKIPPEGFFPTYVELAVGHPRPGLDQMIQTELPDQVAQWKSSKLARSRWNAYLSERQIVYAAIDAWASLALHERRVEQEKVEGPPSHMQARYLVLHCYLGVVECMLNDSKEQGNNWSELTSRLKSAVLLLDTLLQAYDSWYALLVAHQDTPTLSMPESHHFSSLKQLFECYNLVRDHAERTLTNMEMKIASQRERLLSFLTPLHEQRDEIKARHEAQHGPGSWTSNPRPKNDHSAPRRDAERELKIVEDALSEIQALRKMDLFDYST